MGRYSQVALGGTFDILHLGHLVLLKKSFEIGNFVIIGVTSDEFVLNMLKKKIKNTYEVRIYNLVNFIEKNFNKCSDKYQITKLNDTFGPLMVSDKIECLVVSNETESKGKEINNLRQKLGLPNLDIVSIGLVLAKDGRRISSSRIRANEIDPMGNIILK